MIFKETTLRGAYIIEPDKREDGRGFFTRIWCRSEFEAQGLNPNFVQANLSYNVKKGTLRGMHYQIAPFGESKLVRCTRGSVYDVIIDLRPASPTFRSWLGAELSATNYKMLFVPEGFAHGFLSLADDAELTYQVSQFYHPESEHGVRYDDPAFGIEWPIEIEVISDKDKGWPDFAIEGEKPVHTGGANDHR
jgi:dTDP-4-dehydrorhamnose 3,5-epimerase